MTDHPMDMDAHDRRAHNVALVTTVWDDHDLDEAELDVLGDTMKAAAKRARAAAKAAP